MKLVRCFIVLIIVAIVIFSVYEIYHAYKFAEPLVKKPEVDIKKVDRLFDTKSITSLPSIIDYVAEIGGKKEITPGFRGTWKVDPIEDFIEVSVMSKKTPIASDKGWIPLTGETCPPSKGKLGVNNYYVVCAKSESKDGEYQVSYRLWCRELEGYKSNIYRIDLECIGKTESSNVNSISIERTASEEGTVKVSITLIE